MAHSLSAKKRIRQNEKARLANRSRRSALKSTLRTCLESFSGGDLAKAEQGFKEACKSIDRESARGLIHRNNAARRKSALARQLAALRSKKG